jgi:hypothetical protein
VDKRFLIPDIKEAIETKAFPTVTMWNRQEGRPRTDNFTRALQAEVRDAVWMLTRQWQLGEFQGDDAGTPVKVKVQISTVPFDRFKAADGSFGPMTSDVPLETLAERRRIVMETAGQPVHLDLRLQLGRRWAQLLRDAGLEAYIPLYRDAHKFTLPNPDDPGAERVYAHLEAWQQYAAIAGRAIDGHLVYAHVAQGSPNAASDGIALIHSTDKPSLDRLGLDLVAWFDRLYLQPLQSDAWVPSRLEYQFSCAAGGDELTASEYYEDTPDWYVFNGTSRESAGGGTRSVVTVLPTAVEFDGMPDTRWWSFEDRKTNLGDVSPSTTDLAKLLLMEFALVYANDWFVIPFRLPINAVARVDALMVTNTFGEHHWIDASGSRPEDAWQRWAMFAVAGVPTNRPGLVLPALTAKAQAGESIEVVNLIRDEIANMVWGVECTIPLVSGYGRAGRESAVETRHYFEKQVAAFGGGVAPELPYRAKVSYLAMTRVPEHWIPFMPVHVDGSNREIQLQRSKMLRLIDGDHRAPEPIAPRTSLLREGLDESPRRPYLLHEEEVLRAGIRVTQSFQRTRWVDGQVYVWLAAAKQTGRGEGSSGLAFDQLSDVSQP